MDIAPGYKTKITAIIDTVFNVLVATGVLDITPELVDQINAGLFALIGLFLAIKIDRKPKSE